MDFYIISESESVTTINLDAQIVLVLAIETLFTLVFVSF
jgi:hypothetical protein